MYTLNQIENAASGRMRRIVAVSGILLSATFAWAALTACATSIPGTYRWTNPYEQKTLILRPDHNTFRFHISSDVGTSWLIEGTWKLWDPARPDIVETRITQVLAGPERAPYSWWWSFGLWRVGRGSAVPWNQYLTKVSDYTAPRQQQQH